MPKYVTNETTDDDVVYVAFGKLKAGLDATKSLLVKEKESIEGILTNVTNSDRYGKTFRFKVANIDKPVVITGKTDLVNKMGLGDARAKLKAEVNDMIQITFLGVQKTAKGNTFYKFEVGIDKAVKKGKVKEE
jgi:hypothetical protein